jgi:hypothetical protein
VPSNVCESTLHTVTMPIACSAATYPNMRLNVLAHHGNHEIEELKIDRLVSCSAWWWVLLRYIASAVGYLHR